MNKPNQASIDAAQAVGVYLAKEEIYLDERQAEQVALAIESQAITFTRQELQKLNDDARLLCDGIEELPASMDATNLSLAASNVLHPINRKLYPHP